MVSWVVFGLCFFLVWEYEVNFMCFSVDDVV